TQVYWFGILTGKTEKSWIRKGTNKRDEPLVSLPSFSIGCDQRGFISYRIRIKTTAGGKLRLSLCHVDENGRRERRLQSLSYEDTEPFAEVRYVSLRISSFEVA